MADLTKTTINYVSPAKLGYYDQKIKEYLEAKDKVIQDALDAEILRAKEQEAKNAQAAKDAQDAADAAQAHSEALAAKVGTVEEGKTVVGMIEDVIASAYDDTEVRGLISALDANKADKTQVATDIADAVKAETDARVEAVGAVQNAVDTLSGTHATDKKALEDAIALKADQTALNAVSDVANAAATKVALQEEVDRAKGEEARIEGLVAAEAAKAREEEGKLDARLVEVETFFKTADNETIDDALDTLVEIQKYLDGEGAVADQMLLDIAANKKAIEDHVATNHDFATADATLKSELEGQIATKADSSVVEVIDGRLEVVEGKVTTLEGEMDAVEGRMDTAEGKIADLEAKFTGENSVDAKIEAAEEAAKEHANGLDSAMNARVEALEAVDHEHANKALLDTYTQTEADLADAVSKKHAHDNADVLAGITAEKVSAWDASEQNAKDYADGLNTSMDTRVDSIETSLAEGGATALAIADAKKAGTDAQNAVNVLAANVGEPTEGKTVVGMIDDLAGRVTEEETKSANFEGRLAALESVEHVEMTNDEIDALFAPAQAE